MGQDFEDRPVAADVVAVRQGRELLVRDEDHANAEVGQVLESRTDLGGRLKPEDSIDLVSLQAIGESRGLQVSLVEEHHRGGETSETEFAPDPDKEHSVSLNGDES